MVGVASDIEFKKIEATEIWDFIEVGFDGDSELLEKYQPRKGITMSELVLINVENALEWATENDVQYYGLSIDGISMGFTILSKKRLYGFGINIWCRSKETVLEWFEWVKKQLGPDFVVSLYKENTRAIDFFLRNGMEIFNEDEKVIYLILNDLKCP